MNWFARKPNYESHYKELLKREEYFCRLWIARHDELEKKFRAVCHENNKLRQRLYPTK